MSNEFINGEEDETGEPGSPARKRYERGLQPNWAMCDELPITTPARPVIV